MRLVLRVRLRLRPRLRLELRLWGVRFLACCSRDAAGVRRGACLCEESENRLWHQSGASALL